MVISASLIAVGKTYFANTIALDNDKLRISFQRTVRVPEWHRKIRRLPDLGRLPLFPVDQYARSLPTQVVQKGGIFIPLYQQDATWIRFEYRGGSKHRGSSPLYYYLIRVYAARANVGSAEPGSAFSLARNDYVKVPGQWRVEGVPAKPDVDRQFVAPPLDSEATDAEKMIAMDCMIKIMPVRAFDIGVRIGSGVTQTVSVVPEMAVVELKALLGTMEEYSMLPHQQELIFATTTLQDDEQLGTYNLQEGNVLHLIRKHDHDEWPSLFNYEMYKNLQFTAIKWNKDVVTTKLHVYILNSKTFRDITGKLPPKSPVSIEQYADALIGVLGETNGEGHDEAEWMNNSEDWLDYQHLTCMAGGPAEPML
ncbi:hypothetical protein MFIFM68171_09857 [Madurella fahalii]|uniref:Ubiquitin-like domain-containing protein n=1 Tax=Madurella fahalii TaxID=1157608 RepID=A0ABQ0GPH6_9PEZI